MRWLLCLTVFGIILLTDAVGIADEPIAALPDDGWWAKYSIRTRQELANNEMREFSWKCTISLVGTSIENGEKCRWVEMKLVWPRADKEKIRIAKFLVPEKDLLESDQPLDRLVRGWIRTESNNSMVYTAKTDPNFDTRGGLNAYHMSGWNLIIFPGLRRNFVKVDEPKTIEYQQERMEITNAVKGKSLGKTLKDRMMVDHAREFEFMLWSSQAVEPGIAAAKVQTKYFVGNVLETRRDDEWVIQDFGKDAKSELPENN